MTNFIGFVVVVVALGVLAYMKVPAVKAFIDSKFKKPAQNAVDVIRAPFRASDTDVATPAAPEPQKPVVEAPVKPQAHIPGTLPGSGYSTVSPEVAAELARRTAAYPDGEFGPLAPTVEAEFLDFVGDRIKLRMKAKQKVVINTHGKAINVVGVEEGGFDSRFATSTDFSTGAYGTGYFPADSAGYVTLYSEKTCVVHINP